MKPEQVLVAIHALLLDPNPLDPLDNDAVEVWGDAFGPPSEKYLARAREWTEKYAKPPEETGELTDEDAYGDEEEEESK